MPKNQYVCDCHPIDEDLVAHTKEVMPPREVFDRLGTFFHLIGDSTRCKLLFALKEAPMCVCDLANVLSMTKSSISHQLNKMKTAGVVKCQRQGKQMVYSLDDHHVFEVFNTALIHVNHTRCHHEE